MKVTKVDVDALNALLKLEVKKEDFEPEILKTLKDYRKKADLKGFRKGQVPLGVIKKMYGNSVLMDVINNLLSEETNKFISENKLDILGHPMPKEGQDFNLDINKIEDFTFEYEIGIAPEFELDYLNSKPTFERKVPKADKKIIDDELSRIQKQGGELENVDSIKEKTDMLLVKLQEIDEKEKTVENGILNSTSISLELIKNDEIASKIKKLKVGEELIIDIFNTFTQDDDAVAKHILDTEKDKVGSTNFKLTLEEIKRIKASEINEEFLKKIYGAETSFKNEEDLRKKVKSDLEEYFVKQADNKMFNEVYKTLIKETKLDLPDVFLKRWIKLTNENPISDEQIEKEYPAFRDNLVWSLIVKNLKKSGEINVSEEDIKAKTAENIKMQFIQYGMANFGGAELDNFVQSMMKDEKHVEETKNALLEEKIFQYIKTLIDIKDKKVSLEEFNKQS